jgi:hypothetical protein
MLTDHQKMHQRDERLTKPEKKVMRHVAEKLGFKLESLRKSGLQKDGLYKGEASYLLL